MCPLFMLQVTPDRPIGVAEGIEVEREIGGAIVLRVQGSDVLCLNVNGRLVCAEKYRIFVCVCSCFSVFFMW